MDYKYGFLSGSICSAGEPKPLRELDLEAQLASAQQRIAELEGLAPRWRYQTEGATHWDGCWNEHRVCALGKIAELEKQLAEARRETIEECAAEAHVRIGHLSPEVPIDYDNGAEELGWNQACTDIEAAIRSLADAKEK